jgi:hypothetical protein
MSKIVSTVLKPFQKITGAAGGQLPPGHEFVQTGTETRYRDVSSGGPAGYITADQYTQQLAALPEIQRTPGGQSRNPRALFEAQYKAQEQPVYEVLPINRNQQAAPASPSVPPPAGTGTLASPSGGPQPSQPTQPTTSATATVPGIQPASKTRPAAPINTAAVSGPGPAGSVSRRRRGTQGRSAFVKTSSLGVPSDPPVFKQRLGG